VGFSSATQSVKINDNAESNFRERPEQSNVFADPLLLIERSVQPSKQSEQSEQSERSIPISSRTPSPPRQIAARLPSPPMVLGPQEDPLASNAELLHWNMMRHSPVNTLDAQLKRYTPVPMGLPHTSQEWLAESNKHEKNEEENSEEMRTVVSPKHDGNDEYYFEGTQLFQVQKTNESYDREDRDLAASLRRNEAAAAATAARK
jgi:hypothetical protein